MFRKIFRTNEVGYITGFRSKKLRSEPAIPDDPMNKLAQKKMLEKRKRFDTVYEEKRHVEAFIQKLKIEIQKFEKDV